MNSTRGDGTDSAVAIVTDIAAAWDDYLAQHAVRGSVPGLILHLAGPTDDGVRTIDVWASAAARHAARDRVSDAFDELAVPPVVRELSVLHLVSSPTLSSTRGITHEQ